jgi:hypothetical protein
MINHFKTHLLNRPQKFFADSVFSLYTDPEFTPAPYDTVTEQIDTILFRAVHTGSLRDYRFMEFLRLIRSCGLYQHVLRFDTRETYRLDDYYPDAFAAFVPPERRIADVIEESLALKQSDYFDLFFPLRERFPEYEEGFRHITDTIHKFCMILFAQALRLEQRKQ